MGDENDLLVSIVRAKVAVLVAVIALAASMPAGQYGGGQQGGYGGGQQAGYGGGRGGYGYAAPEPYEDRDYKFSYNVKDDYTYNQQTRDEQKYGNTITGQYTVLEPTGELRVVNYVADDNGFRADVQNQGGYGNGYKAPAPAPANYH